MKQNEIISVRQKEVWEWKEKAAADYFALPEKNRLSILLSKTSEEIQELKQRIKSKKQKRPR